MLLLTSMTWLRNKLGFPGYGYETFGYGLEFILLFRGVNPVAPRALVW